MTLSTPEAPQRVAQQVTDRAATKAAKATSETNDKVTERVKKQLGNTAARESGVRVVPEPVKKAVTEQVDQAFKANPATALESLAEHKLPNINTLITDIKTQLPSSGTYTEAVGYFCDELATRADVDAAAKAYGIDAGVLAQKTTDVRTAAGTVDVPGAKAEDIALVCEITALQELLVSQQEEKEYADKRTAVVGRVAAELQKPVDDPEVLKRVDVEMDVRDLYPEANQAEQLQFLTDNQDITIVLDHAKRVAAAEATPRTLTYDQEIQQIVDYVVSQPIDTQTTAEPVATYSLQRLAEIESEIIANSEKTITLKIPGKDGELTKDGNDAKTIIEGAKLQLGLHFGRWRALRSAVGKAESVGKAQKAVKEAYVTRQAWEQAANTGAITEVASLEMQILALEAQGTGDAILAKIEVVKSHLPLARLIDAKAEEIKNSPEFATMTDEQKETRATDAAVSFEKVDTTYREEQNKYKEITKSLLEGSDQGTSNEELQNKRAFASVIENLPALVANDSTGELGKQLTGLVNRAKRKNIKELLALLLAVVLGSAVTKVKGDLNLQ